MLEVLGIEELTAMVLIATGISLAVTCTKAGYPIRYFWCSLWRWRWTRWLWKPALCPHCNSFWSGTAVAWVLGYSWPQILQVAFTALGIVYILQRVIQRDRGFVILDKEMTPTWSGEMKSVSLEPIDEDFEEILELEE